MRNISNHKCFVYVVYEFEDGKKSINHTYFTDLDQGFEKKKFIMRSDGFPIFEEKIENLNIFISLMENFKKAVNENSQSKDLHEEVEKQNNYGYNFDYNKKEKDIAISYKSQDWHFEIRNSFYKSYFACWVEDIDIYISLMSQLNNALEKTKRIKK